MIGKKELDRFGLLPLMDMKKGGDTKEYMVRTTSGTSGNAPVFLIQNKSRNQGRLLNIEDSDKEPERIIFVGSTLNASLSGVIRYLFSMRKNPYAMLALDKNDMRKNLQDVFYTFKPEGLGGTPSLVSKALSFINNKEVLRRIRAVRFSGEMIGSAEKKYLKKIPCVVIENLYASTEVGYISGPPCKYLSKNQYHPYEKIKIEIINQDKDGAGDLIVSYHLTPSIYIERYQTGDAGRMIEKPCPCGHPTTFELLGRKDFDFIRFLGITLTREEFDRVTEKLKEYIVDYRGEAREVLKLNTPKGEIILNILGTSQLKKKTDPEAFLRDEITRRLFVSPTKTLGEVIIEGIILPLKINIVTHFEYKNKPIRLKRVL